MVSVVYKAAFRNKFYQDSLGGIAPCPPEVVELLRGSQVRVTFCEHIIIATRGSHSCVWYYDITSQEYVIKTEVPSLHIKHGSLEDLLNVLRTLYKS